ncbi:MAG: phosphoribosylglycinamide formyltransferase [Enterococcus lacertideformus]|uniref:Phosphoribosylglycinamide formyltransferase n=1 Tax=Enterococcus lacertideformus TaxID=2771493 RepID=A0A931F9P8_9ENTE|nr:phosphoribosylglycinamide formyltransferase [Enterococcus lacertideformus]
MKIAVFASGNGSNFQAIVEHFRRENRSDTFEWLFCDQPKAHVLHRAKKLGVPFTVFSPKEFSSKDKYEEKILEVLIEKKIDLIILAGYMRIIGANLLDAYESRIINIHPSLLPAFPGLYGIRDAFEAKVPKTGVTIHYVDKGVDTGPIIYQEVLKITDEETLEQLETKIHQVEHRIYPKIIEEVIEELSKVEEQRND